MTSVSANDSLCTINAGSSSIRFAWYGIQEQLQRGVYGKIDGIGRSEGCFAVSGTRSGESFSRLLQVPDHFAAAEVLLSWMDEHWPEDVPVAVVHRVVHGGPRYGEPALVTDAMINELQQLICLAPDHLPQQIFLMEAFSKRHPGLRQIACFDTTFHQSMPRVARLLPIPQRYEQEGIRRYGFHGLSYTSLMQQLVEMGDIEAANGRIILAHLGGGASITAVHKQRCMDTSMSLTPASGLVMGTRTGDIDPGLGAYLSQRHGMTTAQFDHMVNHESGLLGISGTSPDMRDLLMREAEDRHAADAVEIFCYEAKKLIGAYIAVLGGLDTLVFSGGIGENSPAIRSRICQSLEVFDVLLDETRNTSNARVVSQDGSSVTVRVLCTDEERVMAQQARSILLNE